MIGFCATRFVAFSILLSLAGCNQNQEAATFSGLIAYESQGTGYSQLTGVIKNNTNQNIKMISIRPRIYASDGSMLPYWPEWLEFSIYKEIPAGSSVQFSTTVNDISKYKKQPEAQRIEIDVRQIFYE